MATTANPSYDQVSASFVTQYYTSLTKDPKKIHKYYKDESRSYHTITTVTENAVGQEKIREMFEKIDFTEFKAKLDFVDSQPSLNGSVLVVVHGSCSFRNSAYRRFVQTFVLAAQQKGYYVLTDVFRIFSDDQKQTPTATPVQSTVATSTPAPNATTTSSTQSVPTSTSAISTQTSAAESKPVTATAHPETKPTESKPVVATAHPETKPAVTATPAPQPKQQETKPAQQPAKQQETKPAVAETKPAQQPKQQEKPAQQKQAAETKPAPQKQQEKPAQQKPAAQQPAVQQQKKPEEKPKPTGPPTYASILAGQGYVPTENPLGQEAAAQSTATPTATTTSNKQSNQQQEKSAQHHEKNFRPQQGKRPESAPQQRDAEFYKRHIFLAQLPENVTEDDIKSAFNQFGKVTSVEIKREKNVAFVGFESNTSAQNAIKAAKVNVKGKDVSVDERKPPKNPNEKRDSRPYSSRGGRRDGQRFNSNNKNNTNNTQPNTGAQKQN